MEEKLDQILQNQAALNNRIHNLETAINDMREDSMAGGLQRSQPASQVIAINKTALPIV